MSGTSSSSGISRFAALVLGAVVLVCLSMIGGTGYLKYRLDRAQTVLTAPDSSLAGTQDLFDQLRKNWGFGGFMGLAQKFVFTHDPAALAKMKDHIKTANDIVAHMPNSISRQTQQELDTIAALFRDALQKMDGTTNKDVLNEINTLDLAPLYAALPALDARRMADNADARLAAQNEVQFWAMLLTFASWASLVIAAACAAGIYLILRTRQSAPLRALVQSIQNMARGDMRTAIWGIERQDAIGELARAMDIARYHFSHLPDVSLQGEDGPVRLRFEGGSRSLFEAMMKALSDDSQNIRAQSSNLVAVVSQQMEAITALSAKVEAILHNIAECGTNGDKQLSRAIHEMVASTEALKNSHVHAADQLNRILPAIQDRAQGLADITQLTGKQLTHTLQSLASTEISLKTNAEKSKETLEKLSSTADNLGERLFGAINLLQASGKVLGETTETIKSNWSEIAPPSSGGKDWTPQLNELKQQLADLQSRIENQLDAQTGIASALEQHAQQDVTGAATSAIAPVQEQLEQLSGQLAELKDKINELTMAESLAQATASPAEQTLQNDLVTIGNKIDELMRAQAQAQETASPTKDALQGDLLAIGNKLAELTDLEGRVAVFISALPGDLRQAMREEIQLLAEKDNSADIQQKIASLQETLAASPNLSGQLSEIGNMLTSRIDEQRTAMDGKQQEISAKLAELGTSLVETQQAAASALEEFKNAKPSADASLLPELKTQFLDQWCQLSAQIEASHASLAEAVSAQISELESRMATTHRPSGAKTTADYAMQIQIEKQTEVLVELVNTLSLLDAHVQQFKADIHAA